MVDNVSSVTTFDSSAVDNCTSSVEQKNDAIIGIIKKKTRIKDKDTTELLILIDIRRLVEDEEPVTLPDRRWQRHDGVLRPLFFGRTPRTGHAKEVFHDISSCR